MASRPADIQSPDGALIWGPDELVRYALGDDQLDRLFDENPEYIVIDLLNSRQVTLRALDQFNRSGPPRPAIADHTQVKLLDPIDPEKISLTYVLTLDEGAPLAQPRYRLNPLLPTELPPSAPPGRDMLDQLSALSDGNRVDDMVLILEGMILDREIALSMLRDLVEMHRDAVQNAVDTVQTKRVDFLENPEESSLLDYAFGLVIGAIAAALVSSALEILLGLVAIGVFRMMGRRLLADRNGAISALIRQRSIALNRKTRDLARLRPAPADRRNAASKKARKSAALKAEIQALKTGNEKAESELGLTWARIAADAKIRSQALRARLSRPVRPDGTADPVGVFGSKIVGEVEEKVADMASSVEQLRADTAARSVALPVDVAMKMEVQDYFVPWLAAAESTVHYLKQARLALMRNGELPDDALGEIAGLAAEAARLDDFTEHAASFASSSADPRGDLTNSYELLLWLTMYQPQLSRVAAAPARMAVYPVHEITGRLPGPRVEVLTFDRSTQNLLRYLSQRFRGKGTIRGEGQAAELVFTEGELFETHKWLANLCTRLFQPSAGSSDAGAGGGRPADAPVEIRLAITKYNL